jgi:hypothetical protein
MRQSEAEDKRVRGDEYGTCDKQYPGAGKHTTVFFHDLHPLAAMAEITCNTEPPQTIALTPANRATNHRNIIMSLYLVRPKCSYSSVLLLSFLRLSFEPSVA